MRENEKTILVGKTDDEIYTCSFMWKDAYNKPENQYAAITCDGYSSDFFTDDEGEARAREDLEEGEIWKMMVADGKVTIGLDDWIEQVLDIDGWRHVLGDVSRIDDDLNTQMISAGSQHSIFKKENREDFTDLKLTDSEMDIIFEFTKKLHTKNLLKYTDEDKSLFDKVCEIFKKYPKFEMGMLKEYAEGEEE